MGGGAPQQPQLPPGNAPIPVGQMPLLGQPNPFQPVSQPQSMKGGQLSGLPSLQDTFNVPMGANPLFQPSQSFPQAPLTRPGQFPWPMAPDQFARAPGRPVPGVQPIPAAPPPASTPTPPARLPQEDREIQGGDR